VSLTFITGDLSLKNYETESYFAEDFTEYSLSSPGCMAKYIGFTDDEVNDLCKKKFK